MTYDTTKAVQSLNLCAGSNCNHEISEDHYIVAESDLESSLLQAYDAGVKEADAWVRDMLFKHDGSDKEYKAWIDEWDKFLKTIFPPQKEEKV